MTSTEALNNFFLSVIIIFTVYFILDLIGNAMLLKSTGQKMWIGFIPIVNDFFIFRSFWNAKMFVVYIASFTINILASKSDNVYVAAIRLIACIIALIVEIMITDRISKAFGKNALWTLGLLIIFPVFAIILGCKGDLTAEAKEKIENKLKKKAEKN